MKLFIYRKVWICYTSNDLIPWGYISNYTGVLTYPGYFEFKDTRVEL